MMEADISTKLTLIGSLGWILFAVVIGALGGAIGGMFVGGKHLGHDLAAMLGSFYGILAALPAAILGFVLLAVT